jgi:hypothetical protein
MTTVTVFRHLPQPIIGVCGLTLDRDAEAFEDSLDWLEATGVLVERFDPETQADEATRISAVREVLASEGNRCLPLILVDGVVRSSTVRPTRAELARIVGRNRLPDLQRIS